jgi:DNA replication protein DnaC
VRYCDDFVIGADLGHLDQKELGRTMRRLERIDVVILDEVGFVPFDRAGGELLVNVLASRHGRRSVLVTTNLAFAEWPRVFGGDEKLTTALLDRLAEHATVMTTKSKSYRMRTRKATATPPSTDPGPAQPADPQSNARSKESRKG